VLAGTAIRLRSSRGPRRRLGGLVAAAAIAAGAGVAVGAGAGGDTGKTGTDPARQEAAKLPLRVQVGQLVVSSFDGVRLPEYLRRRLRRRETAGVIVFGQNTASRPALKALLRRTQKAAGRTALVMTDQEGGATRILRFAGPLPAQPDQGSAGRVQRLDRRAAGQLRSVGVNVALAPVADLPAGPALRGRTFSGSSGAVAARVRAAVEGWRGARVAATAKHFPGIGAARLNTDDHRVSIPLSRKRMDKHLRPFRAAIGVGVPLVMASHALFPAYDRHRIASQSRAILTGLLRDRLGYDGVVITDSIEAEAVVRGSNVATAAERSIAAGADLVLCTGSASWKLVYPRLLRRARKSPAFRRRVEESAARVLRLKRRLKLRVPG
jgi:beta-N-acetylhexosaminidase